MFLTQASSSRIQALCCLEHPTRDPSIQYYRRVLNAKLQPMLSFVTRENPRSVEDRPSRPTSEVVNVCFVIAYPRKIVLRNRGESLVLNIGAGKYELVDRWVGQQRIM